MIPEEKSVAVTRALGEAFGVTAFDDIQQITKGQTTSLVFRMVVRGSAYLLKIILRPDDPSRHYASMKSAAQAGIAPRVWYTDVEEKISITDFVAAKPFPPDEARLRLPRTLRALHGLPPFGSVPDRINTSCVTLLNKGDHMQAFFERFRAANILSPNDTEELFARLAELAAASPPLDLVSSHNDLFKPDNTLFDGSRVWLVDWEAAFLNDRYADLAVVANLLVRSDEEEHAFLAAYFGRPANEYERARLFVMQQTSHVFYALAFLLFGSPIDWDENVLEYGEFQQRFWTGEIDLTDKKEKAMYGRVHWERLLHSTRQDRYREALRIVNG